MSTIDWKGLSMETKQAAIREVIKVLQDRYPEWEFITPPYLGLKDMEVLVRMHSYHNGKRLEDAHRSLVVDFETKDAWAWYSEMKIAGDARMGRLLT